MYRIGIDLGGTNIAIGIVNYEFKLVAQGSVPTLATRDAIAIVDDMATLCKKLLAENGLTEADITSLGIASPGIVDDDAGEIV